MTPKRIGVTLRAYVVGFGDCVLARIPDGTKTRHVLVDFGRAPGQGSSAEQFEAIAKDIKAFCKGHLDLLVVTHEHLDHLEGFLRERKIFDQISVGHLWMGLPSSPTYYSDYAKAQPYRRLTELAANLLDGRGARALSPQLKTLLENNVSNAERLAYLREFEKRGAQVHYLARGKVPKGFNPFDEVQVDVLAPEPDVSVYYPAGRVRSFAAVAEVAGGDGAGGDWWTFPEVAKLDAPRNLSDSDWRRLHETIKGGSVRAARFIDKAKNNTSLCFQLTVAGRRLLFTGDAELESWEVMGERCGDALGPVDFLKVSHHGSRNGTPEELLDRLLPRRNQERAVALVSTRSGTYGTENPVPDARVLRELEERCACVFSTDGVKERHVDIEL